MNFINAKVNMIYWWRSHKETLLEIVTRIAFPLWAPVVLLLLPIMAWDQGDPDEDEEWCKKHNYVYPYWLGWGCHKQVKKWQKAYKEAEKAKKKKAILRELQLKHPQKYDTRRKRTIAERPMCKVTLWGFCTHLV